MSKVSSSWRQLEGAALHAAAGPGLHVGDRHVAVGAVPGRDAVAPPQLAADVPVVDVLEPVEEDLLEALGHDPGALLAHGLHGPLGHGLDVDEPLRLEARLDDVVAALAAADGHLVVLDLDQVTGRVEVLEDARAALLAAEARRTVRRSAFMVASSVMMSMRGRSWRSPVSKSVWSWAGVTFTAPVPKSRSTNSSATTGTSRSTKGMRTRAADQRARSARRRDARPPRYRPGSSPAGSSPR